MKILIDGIGHLHQPIAPLLTPAVISKDPSAAAKSRVDIASMRVLPASLALAREIVVISD